MTFFLLYFLVMLDFFVCRVILCVRFGCCCAIFVLFFYFFFYVAVMLSELCAISVVVQMENSGVVHMLKHNLWEGALSNLCELFVLHSFPSL